MHLSYIICVHTCNFLKKNYKIWYKKLYNFSNKLIKNNKIFKPLRKIDISKLKQKDETIIRIQAAWSYRPRTNSESKQKDL